ncbi:hypothetical protein GCM10010278_79600 [Streptomyces melanogenes]|nr:transposase [Streptomyces melanogenes]GGP89213.1 hypothetical protein GCM10010278_79600 [Streptomyces melanogenes]
MWRIDRTADYGTFQDAARGRADLARIERHWENIPQIIGSIHTGAVRAYDASRMQLRDERPIQPGDAARHSPCPPHGYGPRGRIVSSRAARLRPGCPSARGQ